MHQPDAIGEARMREQFGGAFQHFLGRIEAEQFGLGVELRHPHEVSGRPATDLHQPLAGLERQFSDQPVPPEKIIFSSYIIDIALAPIDEVHQRGVIFRRQFARHSDQDSGRRQ